MEVVLVPFIVEWQTQQSFGQSVEGRVVTPTLTPPQVEEPAFAKAQREITGKESQGGRGR